MQFPKQTVRLSRLGQKNETMGTRGTHGTNYLSQGIKELPRRSRRLNVSRETFSSPSSSGKKKTFACTCRLRSAPGRSREPARPYRSEERRVGKECRLRWAQEH